MKNGERLFGSSVLDSHIHYSRIEEHGVYINLASKLQHLYVYKGLRPSLQQANVHKYTRTYTSAVDRHQVLDVIAVIQLTTKLRTYLNVTTLCTHRPLSTASA